MRTFKEYRQEMILERFLNEMPAMMADSLPMLNSKKSEYDTQLASAPNNKEFDVDSGEVHSYSGKHPEGFQHVYYHKHNGEIGAVSHIINNVQKFVHKGSSDKSVIHDIMSHHIGTHGTLSTDRSNSPGSKHLWTSYVKSTHKNIHFTHEYKDVKSKLTPDNIDAQSDKIWGNTREHSEHKIVATRTV